MATEYDNFIDWLLESNDRESYGEFLKRKMLTERGYFGYSMSNNAVDAYDSGKAPLSKWTKEKIVAAIKDWFDKGEADGILPTLLKYPLGFLRYVALETNEWHHTSSHYNKTKFYEFNDLMINEFIEDPSTIQQEYEKWSVGQAEAKTRKKKEKEGELVFGTLKYRVFTGTRKWAKWSWIEREGYCRKEGDWFVLYNKDNEVILKKKIGGTAQPIFTPKD